MTVGRRDIVGVRLIAALISFICFVLIGFVIGEVVKMYWGK